jgi:hypothetical protein
LEPFTRINKLERDSVSHLEYWSSTVPFTDTTLASGWELNPLTFYCFGPSKKPTQHDFLLLTLTKLGADQRIRTSAATSIRHQ